MKILFIAPLPPPTNGQSLVSKILLDELQSKHDIIVVNMSKEKRSVNAIDYYHRFIQVLKYISTIVNSLRDVELIYLSLSESFLGNLKDIFIYVICYKKIDKMYLQMLGGSGLKKLVENGSFRLRLNKYFIKKVKGVIVEGNIQAKIFKQLISDDRIHVRPNFAEDYLFVSEEDVKKKYSSINTLNILYLSNLLYGKGYEELAEAYIRMDDSLKQNVKITFVGGFESTDRKNKFLAKIKPYNGLYYYGEFINGIEKKTLYKQSHVFCLPTYYPYEGQPISILEAYASGMFVVTTNHGGIPDVFIDNVNGYLVKKKSPDSIKHVIEKIINNKDGLVDIGLYNRNNAFKKYRISVYSQRLIDILN